VQAERLKVLVLPINIDVRHINQFQTKTPAFANAMAGKKQSYAFN
jgi:hypothetical protein